MKTSIIFIVGLLVSLAVSYALFAYTIREMGTNEKKTIQRPKSKANL